MMPLNSLIKLYIDLFEEYLSGKTEILEFEKKFYGLYLNRDERNDLPQVEKDFEETKELEEILEPFFWDIEAFHPSHTAEQEKEDPVMFCTEDKVRKNTEESLKKLKRLLK